MNLGICSMPPIPSMETWGSTSNISSTISHEIASGNSSCPTTGFVSFRDRISPMGGTADHYFHANSLQRMFDYMNAFGTCASDVEQMPIPSCGECQSMRWVAFHPEINTVQVDGVGNG